MPRHTWSLDQLARNALANALSARGSAEAGALLAWATMSVDTLHHLTDIDATAFVPPMVHDPAVVDIAHVRWGCGTAITALDQCAAALGRVYVSSAPKRELDLRHFTPGAHQSAALYRSRLSTDALAWVDRVIADPDYAVVHEARNPMTHGRLLRHFSTGRLRTSFAVGGAVLDAAGLVCSARDLATRHVEAFLLVRF